MTVVPAAGFAGAATGLSTVGGAADLAAAAGFAIFFGVVAALAGCDQNALPSRSATDGGSAAASATGNAINRKTPKVRAQRMRPPEIAPLSHYPNPISGQNATEVRANPRQAACVDIKLVEIAEFFPKLQTSQKPPADTVDGRSGQRRNMPIAGTWRRRAHDQPIPGGDDPPARRAAA